MEKNIIKFKCIFSISDIKAIHFCLTGRKKINQSWLNEYRYFPLGRERDNRNIHCILLK